MESFIRFFLPIYFICYFAIAFVATSLLVAKKIGKSPLVLPKDDSAYGLVGRYFKLLLIALFVYVMLQGIFPETYHFFLPIKMLRIILLEIVGIALMILSLIWTIIAQYQMKTSWRIGIDTEVKTELIQHGLFRISRNPIFLGMIISLVGLLLLTPNAVTIIFLILGYVLIQVQIRLEETHLVQVHGEEYSKYKSSVRRFL
jgi:protein-S-isoprenylcysteine O-methyltransferase Ste14